MKIISCLLLLAVTVACLDTLSLLFFLFPFAKNMQHNEDVRRRLLEDLDNAVEEVKLCAGSTAPNLMLMCVSGSLKMSITIPLLILHTATSWRPLIKKKNNEHWDLVVWHFKQLNKLIHRHLNQAMTTSCEKARNATQQLRHQVSGLVRTARSRRIE